MDFDGQVGGLHIEQRRRTLAQRCPGSGRSSSGPKGEVRLVRLALWADPWCTMSPGPVRRGSLFRCWIQRRTVLLGGLKGGCCTDRERPPPPPLSYPRTRRRKPAWRSSRRSPQSRQVEISRACLSYSGRGCGPSRPHARPMRQQRDLGELHGTCEPARVPLRQQRHLEVRPLGLCAFK